MGGGFPPRLLVAIYQRIENFVTLQVSFLLHRLRRRGEGERRGHPAPRPGACKAPWNPLLNGYEGERRGKGTSQASLPPPRACKAPLEPPLIYIFSPTPFSPPNP